MKSSKKDEFIQVCILTLFMVSGLLLLIGFWLESERTDAFNRAKNAVYNYNKLKEDLKEDKFTQGLADEKRLKGAEEGQKDLSSEINLKHAAIFPDIEKTIQPYKRKMGAFWRHSKKLEVPLKQGRSLDMLVGFLDNIEMDRKDIHVEKAVFMTDNYDRNITKPRLWSCSASFVLWESENE